MDDPGSGNFSINISGDENFVFTGEAAFIHATVSGGEMSASGTTLTINMFGVYL